MILTIEEIAVKNIISINIEKSLKEAIILMASSNLRNIVVIENTIDKHKTFYLLTVTDLIDYKLRNLDEKLPIFILSLLITPTLVTLFFAPNLLVIDLPKLLIL